MKPIPVRMVVLVAFALGLLVGGRRSATLAEAEAQISPPPGRPTYVCESQTLGARTRLICRPQ